MSTQKSWQEALEKRALNLVQPTTKTNRCIVWLTRDMRVEDNWALIYGAQKAVELSIPLEVVITIVPAFNGATWRQYDFMLRGLELMESSLSDLGISMKVLLGDPHVSLVEYIESNALIPYIITDQSPIRIIRKWKDEVSKKVGQIGGAMTIVDAHNIVPVWVASDKAEFAARTIRPKIGRLLRDFLTDFPKIKDIFNTSDAKSNSTRQSAVDWITVTEYIKNNVDMSVAPSPDIIPGEKEAKKVLDTFLGQKIQRYDEDRNDPNKDTQSGLSPYLHFGHISSQRVVLEAMKVYKRSAWSELSQTFYDEIIVRKELSDNFCYYNPDTYDSIDGAPEWARKTLESHRGDKREYVYTRAYFEQAKTHDEIWNASQREMLETGKMHGYMRMYWAKKILEWSATPEDAISTAIYLNDRYELDGRDPNGYVGILWSIAGLHDRAWFPRPIFGTIRYMAESGLRKKFDVDEYVKKFRAKLF